MVKHRNSSPNYTLKPTKTLLQTLLCYLSALQTLNVSFPRVSIGFCKGLEEVTKCNSGFWPEIWFSSDGRQQEGTLKSRYEQKSPDLSELELDKKSLKFWRLFIKYSGSYDQEKNTFFSWSVPVGERSLKQVHSVLSRHFPKTEKSIFEDLAVLNTIISSQIVPKVDKCGFIFFVILERSLNSKYSPRYSDFMKSG